MSNYEFVQIEKNHLSKLLPIFEDAFGVSPSLNSLKNKHDTNFTGCSEMGYIAYDNLNEAVAFYGVFPIYVIASGKKLLISQSGDTMVKKNHSGKGLFTQLAKQTYDLCKKNKIKAVFGFPSYTSYYGFIKKLNWSHIENLSKFHFYILTIPLTLFFYRFKLFQKIHKSWVSFVLSFFSSGIFFKSSTSLECNNEVFRDKNYWIYKMLNKDIHLIKINNCNIALKVNKYIEIGDIDYKSLSDLKKIIQYLKFLSFIFGINIIKFYCSPSCRIEDSLKSIKLPTKGLPIGFRTFSPDANLSKVKYTYLDMDTF